LGEKKNQGGAREKSHVVSKSRGVRSAREEGKESLKREGEKEHQKRCQKGGKYPIIHQKVIGGGGQLGQAKLERQKSRKKKKKGCIRVERKKKEKEKKKEGGKKEEEQTEKKKRREQFRGRGKKGEKRKKGGRRAEVGKESGAGKEKGREKREKKRRQMMIAQGQHGGKMKDRARFEARGTESKTKRRVPMRKTGRQNGVSRNSLEPSHITNRVGKGEPLARADRHGWRKGSARDIATLEQKTLRKEGGGSEGHRKKTGPRKRSR